ncbi:PDR/VanB family oxidoreductase [Nocardioides endophyticus]|uniref:PDR/VanB family oxidoreductase n=1 Tax=Nocardioides endophyticus TaxID=1353775 RepID=UPI0031ECF79D
MVDVVADASNESVRTLVVSRKQALTADVTLLDLRDPEGAALPAWEPGAHVDLVLPDDMVRQYSLCSDPGDAHVWQVGVLREPAGRGGSIHIHDVLAEGDTLEVRGPRNNFPLEPAESYLFIGGGIGITPLIPMIDAAISQGTPWELVYGGRSRDTMCFVDQLESYGDQVAIRPQDVHGLLDLPGMLGEARVGTAVYCCGPEPLLQAVEAACASWPAGALHLERFSAKELEEPVRSDSFEIELTVSDVVLTVPPDRSIMQVMEDNGIPVVASCMEGTCGSCETVVLGGTPDHRDSILSPAEQEASETMMVCVSRSVSPRLTLEI